MSANGARRGQWTVARPGAFGVWTSPPGGNRTTRGRRELVGKAAKLGSGARRTYVRRSDFDRRFAALPASSRRPLRTALRPAPSRRASRRRSNRECRSPATERGRRRSGRCRSSRGKSPVSAALASSLAAETPAARAMCQPPRTMPASFRYGTEPAKTPLMSPRYCFTTYSTTSSRARAPASRRWPSALRSAPCPESVVVAADARASSLAVRRTWATSFFAVAPPSRKVLRPTRSLAWMAVVPS